MPSSEGTLEDNRWTQWIRENAPVAEIEFKPIDRSDLFNSLNAWFSSDMAPDICRAIDQSYIFYQNGVVMEITDEMLDKMPNYKSTIEKYPILKKTAMSDGKMVYLTDYTMVRPNHTIVIRKDWLDNLGMDLPTTPEELYDIIYAFTYNDPDKNGVDDTWGINLTADAQRVLSHMYGFPNPSKYYMDENGELTYAWDRIESWLEFVKKIVDNKCINPDFVTMKGDDDQADFLNGKIGIWCQGRFATNGANLYRDFKTAFPEGELDTFPLPETEYGTFNAYLNGGSSIACFINKDAEDIDAVLSFLDWLYDPEVTSYLNYGPDGDYYAQNEDGTHVLVPENSERKTNEFDWASYGVSSSHYDPAHPERTHVEDQYNVWLAGDDPVLWEMGDLYYKMWEIANDKTRPDPRKWINDGKPILPDELDIIYNTADKLVNDALKAAMSDSSKTAAEAVEEAKKAWYDAGGQQVDDFFAEYYRTAGDNALLMSDFVECMEPPVMTDAAKAHSKLFD